MKAALSCLFVIGLCFRLTGQSVVNYNDQYNVFTELLEQHVAENGNVNYRGFIKEKPKFEKFLEFLSQNKVPDKASKEEKLVYWINCYNAFTIKLIVDHYPLERITDLHPLLYIPGFNTVWHEEFFKIGGEAFSLDRIEHEILRKEFDEVRIHFAINCASRSCPNLRNEAYYANKLEVQLDDQAKRFMNDETKNVLSKNQLELSKIFKWFESDFDDAGGLITFIQPYVSIPISKSAKISYLSYDWSLNE